MNRTLLPMLPDACGYPAAGSVPNDDASGWMEVFGLSRLDVGSAAAPVPRRPPMRRYQSRSAPAGHPAHHRFRTTRPPWRAR